MIMLALATYLLSRSPSGRQAVRRCLLSIVMLVMLGGCNLTQPQAIHAPPVVFQTQPDLNQLMQAVNASSSRITSLQSTGADLSVPGAPQLQTSIAMERPNRFRLRSQTGFTGTELDLGSNDQVYWLWAKRNNPPALFFGRHSDFQSSQARQVLPIPPHWLIEALGVVFFDPAALHEGPYPVRADTVEIRSQLNSPLGTIRKSSLVDWQRAIVTEQHVYDQQGQRLASVRASNFQQDLVHQVSLPRTVQIQLPSTQLDFTLQIYGYSINQLVGDSQNLFALPEIPGVQMIDLNSGAPVPTAAPTTAPPIVLPAPPAGQPAGTPPAAMAPATTSVRMLPPLPPPSTATEPGPSAQMATRRTLWPFQRIR
ncbi:MAG: hypothetical protein U0795_10480 [Pirellulales bacterium]